MNSSQQTSKEISNVSQRTFFQQLQYRSQKRHLYESEISFQAFHLNSNRVNVKKNSISRLKTFQLNFRKMFNRSISKNSYINNTQTWFFKRDDSFYIKCDIKNYKSFIYNFSSLSTWKQSYLKIIMFENNFQINFVVIEFEEFDKTVRSFETFMFIVISFIINSTPRISNFSINFFISPKTNFVQYEIIELLIQSRSTDVTIIKINLNKRSISNKRAYI